MKRVAVLALVLSLAGSATAEALPFIRGHLICMRNVNNVLRIIGKRHTQSAAARSALVLPRVHGELRRFDVRFNWRRGGGHVQFFWEKRGRRRVCMNPSERHHGWHLQACPAGGIWVRP